MKENKKSKKFKMPVFGIGPIYVLGCFLITIIGLYLNFKGFLNIGKCEELKKVFIIIGSILILYGLYLWIQAVLVQKINSKVKEGKLITTGVYGLVRNPIYSAFILTFTGILFFTSNLVLFLLPVIFWASLTILMKQTEEKWLRNKFGKEYEVYLSEVNRIIPWFRKK